MSPEERVLVSVVEELEALGIEYMIAGSMASSHHGRPRATQDADVVIDPTPAALDLLVQRLAALGCRGGGGMTLPSLWAYGARAILAPTSFPRRRPACSRA